MIPAEFLPFGKGNLEGGIFQGDKKRDPLEACLQPRKIGGECTTYMTANVMSQEML